MSVLPVPVKDAAVQNNQRIFSTYEASLSDTTHYIEFAGKFALWLDSDRAFYPQGKPSYRYLRRHTGPSTGLFVLSTISRMLRFSTRIPTKTIHWCWPTDISSKFCLNMSNISSMTRFSAQVQFLLHTVGMHLNADTRPHIYVQPSPVVQRPPAPVQTERELPRASTSRAGSSQSPAPLSLPKKKKRNLALLIEQDLDWYAAQNSSAPKTQEVSANEPSLSKSLSTTDTETKLVSASAPATAPVRPSESTSTSGLAVTPQDNAFQTIIQVETKPVPQDKFSIASEIVAEVESKPNVLVSEADETDQLQDDVTMASPQGMDIDDGSNEREEVANLLDVHFHSFDRREYGSRPNRFHPS
ncbi:hypothetical protein F5146DRAFT_48295 [Armillaria mellea]|nr:hypothetical protein F5146DRAFT_48295 [Armillaria mellea]